MAYKFQLGPARLSGSLRQEGNVVADGDASASNVSASSDVLAGGSLTVAGNADLNGQLDVAQQVSLAASGVLTNVRGRLEVAEDADIAGSVILGRSGEEIKVSGSLNADAGGSLLGSYQVGTQGGSDVVGFYAAITSSFIPSDDDAWDLGSSSKQWKDLYIDGVARIDELQADQLGAPLDANSQAITNVDIDSGTMDGVDVTVGAGKTLDVSAGTLTLADDQISGDKVEGGTIASITISQLAGAMDANSQAMTNVNIDSGAIDGTAIGANSQAAGEFTTLSGSGALSIGGAAVVAGALSAAELSGTLEYSVSAGIGMTAASFDNSGDITLNVNGVLEDLNSLGAATADGEFIVATGAGAFAYETGDTARTSLGLGTGDSPQFTGLTLTGDMSVQGNTVLGNADSDTVAFVADLSSSIVPAAASQFDLGSSSDPFQAVYADRFIGDIAFDVADASATGNIAAATDLQLVSAASAATMTLPDISGNGKVVRVKRVGDGLVTVEAHLSDSIPEGVVELEEKGAAVMLVSYGTNWYIL